MKIIGPKKLVKRAQFVCNLFEISPNITLQWCKENEDFSECAHHSDGSFNITIQNWIKTDPDLIQVIGHELVHVWQHMRGDLITMHNEKRWSWKNQIYVGSSNDNIEEYFLRPWELEARSLEAWIEWRWKNK